jgi:Zn-dependent M28 family amino/carboxypeptidase
MVEASVVKGAALAATLVCLLLLLACGGEKPEAANAPAPQLPAKAAASDALPPEQTGGFDGARAFTHVEALVRIGPRQPGSEGIRRAQDYIRGQLKNVGCAVEEDDFQANTPVGRVPMKNIVAKIPGRKSDVLLLLTHYDTLRLENFLGANDSGSSTGLMLEMARLLCARKGELTLWIAFLDGEEAFVEWSETDGTYGSRQMAAKLALSGELKRIRAVLLADMVGDRSLNIKRETASTPWLTDLVWKTAARLGYEKYFVADQHTIEDDHLPFLRRGVPAVNLIDFDYPYWHTPEDTLDKISARSLGIVGHVLLEVVSVLDKRP